MNYGPLIFLGAFFALASSWFTFVLTPHLQVGHLQPTNSVPAGATYPLSRPGRAKEGIEVYRSAGCAYCHSQQVRQTDTRCDVIVTAPGTNQAALLADLRNLPGIHLTELEAKQWLASLPRTVLRGVTKSVAEAAVKMLKRDEVKVELWIVPVGPDISRGWGKRRSVAADFLYDYPVMLGSQRIGPDLADVGSRRPDANWHLRHLYAPASEVQGSVMPPYRFLFEKRRMDRTRSADALSLPGGLAPEPGYEIVPKPEAKTLVAYLLSLRTEEPLYVAPLTVPSAPPAGTNAPAAGTTNALHHPPVHPFTSAELLAIPERR